MKKKIMTIVMCMCLSVGLSSSVMAASLEEHEVGISENAEGGIQPRAAECGNCGTYFLNVSNITYGSWADTGETRKCSKYNNKYDMIETRQVCTTYSCSHCGYTHSVISYETHVNCTH